jgi:hypothetical protein
MLYERHPLIVGRMDDLDIKPFEIFKYLRWHRRNPLSLQSRPVMRYFPIV